MLVAADDGHFIDCTSAFTQTFAAAADLPQWCVLIQNSSAGTVTLDPNGSETIDGATTLAIPAGESRLVVCDGSTFHTCALKGAKGDTGAAGASGTSSKLFDTRLGSDAASIDTTGTDLSGFDVLEIFIIARTSEATTVSGIIVRFNGDSGATQYDLQLITGSNATPTATFVNQSSWSFNVAGANTQAGSAGIVRITIPAYRGTDFHKEAEITSGLNDSSAANNRARTIVARWRSTAAITDVQVTPNSGNLKAGTRVLIYGR